MIGESWFGVLIISISPLLRTNQAQPEPKRPVAAFLNSSLNASKLPNLASIFSATSPFGFPPPFGESTCQKKLWFECPRSEEHTSELQSRGHLVCRLLLEKTK